MLYSRLLVKLILVTFAIPINASTKLPSLCELLMEMEPAPEVRFFKLADEERLTLLTRKLAETPGLKLNGSAAQANNDPELTPMIVFITGVKGGTLSRFYRHVLKNYDSWLEWLNHSGVDGYSIVRKKQEPISDTEIIKIIQAISNSGRPINRKAFEHDTSSASIEVIKEAIGKSHTPAGILSRIRRKKGEQRKWDYWLKKAGFEPTLVRLVRDDIPVEKLEEILLALESTGTKMNAGAVQNNSSEKVARQMFEKTGYALSPSQVYTWVHVALDKPWIPTLNEAGVDLSKIKFSHHDLTEKEAILVIQSMNRLEIPLNSGSVQNDNTITSAVQIYRESQIFITPQNIHSFAKRNIKSGWDGALVKAGFNPDQIRKKGWSDLVLLSDDQYQERREALGRQQALIPKVAFEGTGDGGWQPVAVRDDDSDSNSRLATETVYRVIENIEQILTPQEVEVFNSMVQILEDLSMRGEASLEQVLAETVIRNPALTSTDLQELLAKVSKNEDLKRLLLD